MRRSPRTLALLAAALVFVALSLGLARILTAAGAERTAVGDLVRAEGRGDVAGASGRIRGCSADPRCRDAVSAAVGRISRPGAVQVLRLDPGTSFSLGGSTGSARVAWKVSPALPVVQCVRVRRAGNAVTGLRIELLAVTPPLEREASCPQAF